MTKTIFAPSDYYSVYKSCNSSHPRPMSRASASDEDEKGVIKDFAFTGKSYTLVHDAISPGIYILEVISGNQKWYKKLIVE